MNSTDLVVASSSIRSFDDPMDSVSIRPTVYGESSEGSSYLLHWAHLTEIVDRQFDYSSIIKLKVPRLP